MNTTNTGQKRSGRIAGPAGDLYIDSGGAGPGTAVLLLHSFAGSTHHWTNQLDHFRRNRQVVAFDFRGHGKSDAVPEANYSVESLVKDVEVVVNTAMPERFVVVGHSMGASVALAYTDSHPNRVAGLVLAGSPGKTSTQQSRHIIASLESEQYEKVMENYMEQLLSGSQPEVYKLVKSEAEKLSKATTVQLVKGLFEFNPLPAIVRYKGPKLLIYTSGESKQPNALYNQVTAIPSKMIVGAGHWMQMDNPVLFNQVLEDFLAIVEQGQEP